MYQLLPPFTYHLNTSNIITYSSINLRSQDIEVRLILFSGVISSGDDPSDEPKFSFFSSFQSNLLEEGLAKQVGWGHAWNRYAGPLSCRKQRSQCALTPLLPSGWWDDPWQSPIPRDVRRMQSYGVHLTDSGEVIDSQLQSFCKSRREVVKTIPVYGHM